MANKIKSVEEKKTGYECFCYGCRKEYVVKEIVNCPLCGAEPASVNVWLNGNFIGYPKKGENK